MGGRLRRDAKNPLTLVDSSTWIDYLRGASTKASDVLDQLLGRQTLVTGDLILAEVLQGISDDEAFEETRRLLTSVPVIRLGGQEIAIRAAQNFRTLRRLGITVRRTIDTLIATKCIADGYVLLHNDRDFDPFVHYLGLRTFI